MKKTEKLLYLCFSIAALPLALSSMYEWIYHVSNPVLLEVRDAFTMFYIYFLMPFVLLPLMTGLAIAVYYIFVGPNILRLVSFILILTWPIVVLITPETRFNSMERLYWDAIPFIGLALLPWCLMAIKSRYTRSKIENA